MSLPMSKYVYFRSRLHDMLDPRTEDSAAGKAVQTFIVILIAANVLAVILATVRGIRLRYAPFFIVFERLSVLVFTLEYLARLWSCTSDPRYRGAITGRLRYALSALALVDLMAILPFYLPRILPFDLRVLRAVRLLKLFLLFKLGRYSDSMHALARVIRSKKEDLLVSAYVVGLLLVIASSLMYIVERRAQPEVFSSIPAAMWWGIVTLTTVGYGDVYPVTVIGRMLASVLAVLGVGMFALPAGILVSGFVSEVKGIKEITICPHCGREIDKAQTDRQDVQKATVRF